MPRYIETVPTAGYRFIANVSIVSAEDPSREPGVIAETSSKGGSEADVPAPVVAKRRSR